MKHIILDNLQVGIESIRSDTMSYDLMRAIFLHLYWMVFNPFQVPCVLCLLFASVSSIPTISFRSLFSLAVLLSMYLSLYLSISLSIYLSIYFSIYLPIYLSTYISIYLFISLRNLEFLCNLHLCCCSSCCRDPCLPATSTSLHFRMWLSKDSDDSPRRNL